MTIARPTSLLLVMSSVVFFVGSTALAQDADGPGPQDASGASRTAAAAVPQPLYRIGPDDLLSVSVLQATELNQSVRVSTAGDISMPLIGNVLAAGLTTQELERDIEARFREKFIRDPDVSVIVTEVHSRGVSVVGSVRRPGIVQINGTTLLLELISLAGGLADDAGDSVVILRARGGDGVTTPDHATVPDAIEVDLKRLMEARDQRANIAVHPGDVVNVRAAALVYVVGAVRKPGAFSVRGNDQLTVLRALALGEGLLPIAAKSGAVVVRTNDRGDRVEFPVDLEAVLKGRGEDVPLEAQDVLFVPTSGGKVAGLATINFLTRVVTLRGVLP